MFAGTRSATAGLFSIESHSYWHPNFRIEKRRLAPDAYKELVDSQLIKSKKVLQQQIGSSVTMLSWPFGIYDDDLIAAAQNAGYAAAFTIERHPVRRGDNLMALPRYIVTDQDRGQRFGALLHEGDESAK